MLLYLLSQAATGPTTQQVVDQAVTAKVDQWYTPLVAAIVVALAGLIVSLGSLALAWINVGKAKAAAAEAKAKAEIVAAEAKGRADTAAAKVDAYAALSRQNSERITTTARALSDVQKAVTVVALQSPPLPSDASKGLTP